MISAKFQSTHPHGVRHPAPPSRGLSYTFQSTHPHGVRPKTQNTHRDIRCFNPRTRMGCDLSGGANLCQGYVSIHAPAWGATEEEGRHNGKNCVSIHAPAWGATCRHLPDSQNHHVSIHAPAWGATHHPRFHVTGVCVSIHAPAWGAT